MGENSKIEWCHHTFNPWRGCTRMSGGCKFCYAETLSKRNPAVLGEWGPKGNRVIAAETYWRYPVRWNDAARAEGERKRVFCASLADVFEGRETCTNEAYNGMRRARERLWTLIDQTPWLDWLLLTKRPGNAGFMTPYDWHIVWPDNAWLGTSVEDHKTAEERIPLLLDVPAKVRFLSCEPLLDAIDLEQFGGGIDWVIAGGESGPNARPTNPDWFRAIRDTCITAGIPFFFKQIGEWEGARWNDYGRLISVTGADLGGRTDKFGLLSAFSGHQNVVYHMTGKRAAGRLLDGRTWDDLPRIGEKGRA